MSLGKHIARWGELGVHHAVKFVRPNIYSTPVNLYDDMHL